MILSCRPGTCKVEVPDTVQSEQPEVFEKEEIRLSRSSTLLAARPSLEAGKV